jgi:PAS domain S-box-containing protein
MHQSRQFKALAQTSADAIIVSDASDTILVWNPAAERIFGYGQDILGQPVATIMPPDYRQRHKEGLKQYIKTGRRHILDKTVELEALHADGSVFPIELSLSTWQEDDHVFFGAIIRDISERKQLECLQENVNQLIRHDLKSPLISLTGYANLLLKDGGLNERQNKIVQGIFDLGKRTLQLIDRTRDLYLVEAGQDTLDTHPVDLAAILERMQVEMRIRLGSRKVKLSLNLVDRPIATGDEVLIKSMLDNLLKNAAEACPDGGLVTVNLRSQLIDSQKMAEIELHNPGEVPLEVRDSFFEPYATAGKKTGSGLGTYSARLIALAHGGDIKFTSSREQGTNVMVWLPLA